MEYLPMRKPNRFEGYDYTKDGVYFITVCTKNRKNILGHVVVPGKLEENSMRPYTRLSDVGCIVDTSINNIPQKYPYALIDTYVIMPNHLHIILIINHRRRGGNLPPVIDLPDMPDYYTCEHGRLVAAPTARNVVSVKTIIGQMKRFVSMQYGVPIWQKSFHDHIIRNQYDHWRIRNYINDNPMVWVNDCYFRL
jgi:REP element-mobilizing transposase RayT